MALSIRTVEYFYIRVEDVPGNAYDLLARLASEDVNILAFNAVPYGPGHVELAIFPENSERFLEVAQREGWTIQSSQHACLVQGDDRLGALADIQRTLIDSGINVYASSGVTDGNGHFGYIIYVKEEDAAAAAKALGG